MDKLFNTIRLKDGRELYGIVDFISTKQLYFFDFSKPLDQKYDFVLLSVLWRGNTNGMRFSVFCAKHYPGLILPQAILLPISNIDETDVEIVQTPKAKQRRRKIKYVKLKSKERKTVSKVSSR